MNHTISTARWLLVLLVAVGCSKEEKVEKVSGVPRPAVAPSALHAGRPITYAVGRGSAIEFSLPARRGNPSGRVSHLDGAFEVDLVNLGATRGTLRADLTSVAVAGDGTDAGDGSERARLWLELGREAESYRYASFSIHRIEHPSAHSAHEGERVRRPLTWSSEMEHTGREVRRVDFAATGSLTFHGRRAEQTFELSAFFEYPDAALTGVRPEAILIESRKPTTIPVETYDLQPRTAEGTVIAADLEDFGTTIGRKLRILVELRLYKKR